MRTRPASARLVVRMRPFGSTTLSAMCAANGRYRAELRERAVRMVLEEEALDAWGSDPETVSLVFGWPR